MDEDAFEDVFEDVFDVSDDVIADVMRRWTSSLKERARLWRFTLSLKLVPLIENNKSY